jgi:serine/threonine protein phosphatase PrpC
MTPDPIPPPADPPPDSRLGWSGMTHVGRVRANNEDAFLALTFDGDQVRYLGKRGDAPLAATDFVFAVSDGMGGARSGEFASRIAIEQITRLLPSGFRLSAGGTSDGVLAILGEIFTTTHQALLKLGQSYEECAGMGTTLSLCWFTPRGVYFGHIGDSRIYHQPHGGEMRQLTHDHTHVGWLRRNGELNEREARSHPRRNALQQALGAGHQFVAPHLGAVRCQTGDRFLLCSDGVIDGLWDRRIQEVLRSAPPVQELAEVLVTEAVAASGRDNATAVVIEVLPAGP